MPLSHAAPRRPIHDRNIICQGYLRDDGLWDIEGTIIDTKSYFFENIDRGGIEAGDPIHQMTVRLTVDNELTVVSAEASTLKSPYNICPEASKTYSELAGLQIGPGWRREIKKRIGTIKGCTHITDLILGPLAVTAYQTVIPIKQRESKNNGEQKKQPFHLGKCHALRVDGPIVERDWPNYYRDPEN